MREEPIPERELESRRAYRLWSRNLSVGVWNDRDGFIGIREKFGSLFLFTEYLHEQGGPYGTAMPLEALDFVPEDIKITESLGSICTNCGGLDTTYHVRYAEPIMVPDRFSKAVPPKEYGIPGQWICMNCINPRSAWRGNAPLFNWLAELEGIEERH